MVAFDPRTEPLGVPVGTGYCQCGCGFLTPVSTRTHNKYGWVKGQPKRFINGHHDKKHRPFLIDVETGCWEWQANLIGTGYGQFRHCGRSKLAHRHEYEWRYGPIPYGLELDHLCRNKRCVNPDHLEAVTHTENMQRWARAA